MKRGLIQKNGWLTGAITLLQSVGVLIFVFEPVPARSVGFRLPNQDPEAIARGNAFVATADNPSAVYYNPAGITQLEGQHVHVGVYLISTGVKYTSPTGRDARTDSTFQPVPQLYYVNSPGSSDFSFGLGIYVPYGLSLDWGKNTSFRTLAQDGKLLYTTLNPVVAWQVHPTLALAAGPTLNYSEVEFRRGIGLRPNDRFDFEGDDSDYGFNAGVLWHPHPKWAFGGNYRFATTMNYRGESQARPYSASTGTSGKLHFPQFVAAGVSFRPTEKWNLEINVDWTEWNKVNEIVFRGTAGGDAVLPLNYRSSLMYEFGITRQLPNANFISVGYIFSENSIPDKNFNPIVPDAELHLGSIGFGRRGKRWNWAAAYHFAHNPGRKVENSQTTSLIRETADGIYRTFNQAFTASATFKF